MVGQTLYHRLRVVTATLGGTTVHNPLVALADHAAGWGDRPLPPSLERHARRALIDWFAALLPGCRIAPASLLAPASAGGRGAALRE
jgi:hypothetical protein